MQDYVFLRHLNLWTVLGKMYITELSQIGGKISGNFVVQSFVLNAFLMICYEYGTSSFDSRAQ